MKEKQRSARIAEAVKKTGFSAEERAAMKQRAKEVKSNETDGEGALLEKIAEMDESDRAMATRIHAIVKGSAPALSSKLWYGMPAYAREGKIVCFFQPAKKFKTRYATLGFNDAARLDDGNVWPVAYAVSKLTSADEAKIAELVKKAAS
jgi:uncharacterized protein YdhG (YjbR/CyaY superfamily)